MTRVLQFLDETHKLPDDFIHPRGIDEAVSQSHTVRLPRRPRILGEARERCGIDPDCGSARRQFTRARARTKPNPQMQSSVRRNRLEEVGRMLRDRRKQSVTALAIDRPHRADVTLQVTASDEGRKSVLLEDGTMPVGQLLHAHQGFASPRRSDHKAEPQCREQAL